MNKKRLFKKLNKLCLELQDKYNINCGGCCYISACIAEQLELYSIPFELIHYNLDCCHYCIKVSDRYINRDYHFKNEIVSINNYSSDEIYSIYYNNNWNITYDTSNNELIRKIIINLFKNENCRT